MFRVQIQPKKGVTHRFEISTNILHTLLVLLGSAFIIFAINVYLDLSCSITYEQLYCDHYPSKSDCANLIECSTDNPLIYFSSEFNWLILILTSVIIFTLLRKTDTTTDLI